MQVDSFKKLVNETEKPGLNNSTSNGNSPDKPVSRKIKFKLKKNGNNANEQGTKDSQIAKASKSNDKDASKPQLKSNSEQKVQQKSKSKTRRSRKSRKNKKKAKLVELPASFKLIVRNLPPCLSEKSFLDVVFKQAPGFKSLIGSFYYVEGEYPTNPYTPFVYSRCYIGCINEHSLMNIGKMLKLMKFTDDIIEDQKIKDEQRIFSPTIEKAIYSTMPPANALNLKSNNTISEIPLFKQYRDFCMNEGLFKVKEDRKQVNLVGKNDVFGYINKVVNKSKRNAKLAKKDADRKAKEAGSTNDTKVKPNISAKSKGKAKDKAKDNTSSPSNKVNNKSKKDASTGKKKRKQSKKKQTKTQNNDSDTTAK